MDDALIHLRVPAATKAAWVRESRAAGMRLTDWIISRVERAVPIKAVPISIPAGVTFADLKMTRTPDGEVEFDWAPIRLICAASGVDVAVFAESDEDAVSGLLSQWYAHHLTAGGARDAAMDDLIDEAAIEDAHDQPYSHQPGRA